MLLTSRARYAIVFFALSLALVAVAEPKAVFREDGRARPFGTHVAGGETLLSLGVVTVVMAVLSFYVFCCAELMGT